MQKVTLILSAIERGDAETADELLPAVYEQFLQYCHGDWPCCQCVSLAFATGEPAARLLGTTTPHQEQSAHTQERDCHRFRNRIQCQVVEP